MPIVDIPGVTTTVKCLDHGFVTLVDMMGGDLAICNSARLSYEYADRPMVRDDAKLIDYLLEHSHTSPFEQTVFTFHCKMPIFVARQWVRHRTARLNELSARYSTLPEEYYVPEVSELKFQSTENKQGRSDDLITEAEECRASMEQCGHDMFKTYQSYLDKGMTRELARTVLPLSTYTEWYWQMDLHNLFHFLRLRMDSHAQYEIRVYAEAIAEIIKPRVPMAWGAFERHVLYAKKFSQDEMQALREIMECVDKTRLDEILDGMSISPQFKASNNRKIKAFCEKLGIQVP